jgi:hypothetical protein
MTQSELHDQKMAISAAQSVRTHHYVYKAARTMTINAVRIALMYGASREELAEIVGADRLERWVPADSPEGLRLAEYPIDNPATGWSEAEWRAEHDPTV